MHQSSFFFKIILFLSSGTILHPEKCQLLHKHLISGLTYQSTFVLQWKLLLHLYIFYNKRYWGDLNVWNTYIQYMFKTLYMIHTKSIWKKFQLRMVLDYIQHTRILKMLHFIIVIWYILHIMNTIFLLVQYTPKRLTCICLLNNYPNNFAFC